MIAAPQVRMEHLHLAAAYRRRQDAMPHPSWRDWIARHFADYTAAPMAERHIRFWSWITALATGETPAPRVEVWPRGGAKSTSVELGCAYLGSDPSPKRHYVLYVSMTQAQANKHVQAIARMLERVGIRRALNEYGASKGWRHAEIRAANGFNVTAFGLDSGMRGVKLDAFRPDVIVFDDIDDRLDTAETTRKKIEVITTTILPAGAPDVAVIVVQNKVHINSIVSQLCDGRADFLHDRDPANEEPAIRGLAVEQRPDADGKLGYVITGGEPTWAGQDLAVAQVQINRWGITAFRQEAQHDVDAPAGDMFNHLDFRHCAWGDVPDLVRIVVWVDPAVTDTDQSDAHGIQADGLASDGTIYRLYSWEQRTSPEDVLRRAILKAVELKAEHVGVETDQGGDTWRTVYNKAAERLKDEGAIDTVPTFRSDKAGAGHGPKVHRASQMLAAYERGELVHVNGTHETLERALRRFPRTKPLDLVDAAYWSWVALRPRRGGLVRSL